MLKKRMSTRTLSVQEIPKENSVHAIFLKRKVKYDVRKQLELLTIYHRTDDEQCSQSENTEQLVDLQLIVVPRKFNVLKTNICRRNQAWWENVLVFMTTVIASCSLLFVYLQRAGQSEEILHPLGCILWISIQVFYECLLRETFRGTDK